MNKLFLTLLIITLLTSCVSENKKTETEPDNVKHGINDAQMDQDTRDRIWQDYDNIISILSCKYSIEEEMIKDIFIYYLRTYDPSKSFLLILSEKSDKYPKPDLSEIESRTKTSKIINELSTNLLIDKKTIGHVLFDITIWLESKECDCYD